MLYRLGHAGAPRFGKLLSPRGKRHPPSIDTETEAQRGIVTCPESHSQEVAGAHIGTQAFWPEVAFRFTVIQPPFLFMIPDPLVSPPQCPLPAISLFLPCSLGHSLILSASLSPTPRSASTVARGDLCPGLQAAAGAEPAGDIHPDQGEDRGPGCQAGGPPDSEIVRPTFSQSRMLPLPCLILLQKDSVLCSK